MRNTAVVAGVIAAGAASALAFTASMAGADADGSDDPPPGALAYSDVLFKDQVYKTFGAGVGLRTYKFGAFVTAQRYPHGLRLTYKTRYDLRTLGSDEAVFYGATVRLSNGKLVGICEKACNHIRQNDDDAVTRFVIGPPSRNYVWEKWVPASRSVRPLRVNITFACMQGDSYKGRQLCSLVKHLKGTFPRLR